MHFKNVFWLASVSFSILRNVYSAFKPVLIVTSDVNYACSTCYACITCEVTVL